MLLKEIKEEIFMMPKAEIEDNILIVCFSLASKKKESKLRQFLKALLEFKNKNWFLIKDFNDYQGCFETVTNRIKQQAYIKAKFLILSNLFRIELMIETARIQNKLPEYLNPGSDNLILTKFINEMEEQIVDSGIVDIVKDEYCIKNFNIHDTELEKYICYCFCFGADANLEEPVLSFSIFEEIKSLFNDVFSYELSQKDSPPKGFEKKFFLKMKNINIKNPAQ